MGKYFYDTNSLKRMKMIYFGIWHLFSCNSIHLSPVKLMLLTSALEYEMPAFENLKTELLKSPQITRYTVIPVISD